MSTHDDRVYLEHIRDCTDDIAEFLGDLSRSEFMLDRKTQAAVMRQLEIIGEVSRNLSQELKAHYSAVPWRTITDMRNRLIHAYFRVDLNAVWNVATGEVPTLHAQIDTILNELGDEP